MTMLCGVELNISGHSSLAVDPNLGREVLSLAFVYFCTWLGHLEHARLFSLLLLQI